MHRADLRELVIPALPYIIRYAVTPDHVLITRVRHGALDEVGERP